MTKSLSKIIWFSVGVISIVLGLIGAVLPVVPTVPFLLLAAVGFSKSSVKIHNWLINHYYFGPPIRDWEDNQTIRRGMKISASVAMLGSVGLTWLIGVPIQYVGMQAIVLVTVAIFIWSRPEG